ncbi:MAG TPA: ComEC/Rec2 family competence protein [Nocardia sp.]|uniref:ComEC/Rec2 family competence protein n=1 Tax=Nocardia sp. TaxID=1821 RepID=UPI002B4B42B7|nr:ComEC/Rec2 family competence protein [Nocardia sp.]HLS75397.1 ComEC/Rec2 family competence protein [Nocardia sp.]
MLLATAAVTAGFALATSWRAHQVDTHPLRALGEKARVEVVVTPSTDPKPVRGTSFDGEQRWVVYAELERYRRGDAVVRGGGAVVVLASGDGWASVVPGQAITFDARVGQPARRDLTVAVLRAHSAPAVAGPSPWWERVAGTVRAGLREASAAALSEEAAGLLPALVVGDTGLLPEVVREEFETAGLQHLCVVSGANFAIVATAVLALARRMTLGPRASVAAAGAAMAMFVVIARPDPSVLRAAAMGTVTLLALLTGRRKQALPALCAAVVGVLTIRPELAVSAGFALSVLATGGLILLAPGWADRLRDRGWWQLPAELVAVSAAAFTVTLPVMVALTGRVSLVAIAANVLVAPVVAPITVLGALAAAIGWLWPPVAQAILHAAAPPLWWLLTVGDRAAALPLASVGVPGGAAGGAAAAVAAVASVLLIRRTRSMPAAGRGP